MVRISATEARGSFADTLNRVAYGGERVVLHRNDKNVAVIISTDDLELLELLEDRMDLAAARAALKEAEDKGFTDWEDLEKELGI